MTAPNIFLTPNKTFQVALAWDEKTKRFERALPSPEGVAFDLVTPDRKEVHEHYAAFSSIPKPGLDYSEIMDVVWGNPDRKMRPMVARIHNAPTDAIPHPSVTLALMRILRQECGLDPEEIPAPTEDNPTATVRQELPSEGNSGSPSGSGLGSLPSPAGAAGTANADPV
jgi:hypothetical protein